MYKELKISRVHDTNSKGKWNLSKVPCPPCLEDTGYFEAPECYNEIPRRKAIESYSKLPHWDDKRVFRSLIGKIRKELNVSGVSISLIERGRTSVKFETLLDIREMPRSVSLDAHAILSQGFFLLLDASKDWRTRQNPFVTGAPYTKFYCGVPLVVAKNVSIGVLAIFDSFAANDFSEANSKKLQAFAKEVMKILDTPFDTIIEAQKSNSDSVGSINAELKELKLKLGRATSTKSVLKSVFERDGSGGPYTQNQTFRFTKLQKASANTSKIDTKMLWDKLFKIGSMKNSAMALTKAIAINYKLDFVYILEIRIAEPYMIPSEYFPRGETKIESENFRYANKMMKQKEQDTEFTTRIIGVYGGGHSTLSFENAIHYKAFTSEFGIHYKNPKQNSLYNKGVIVPLYRHHSKLIRRTKEDRKMIPIYLRSGGYLIAYFNKSFTSDINQDMISGIFENTTVFRKIYITA